MEQRKEERENEKRKKEENESWGRDLPLTRKDTDGLTFDHDCVRATEENGCARRSASARRAVTLAGAAFCSVVKRGQPVPQQKAAAGLEQAWLGGNGRGERSPEARLGAPFCIG